MLAQAGAFDTGQAFDVLRDHSRRTNTRLSELAHDLVTGETDPASLIRQSSPSAQRP